MITSLARQSVIIKCNMQRSVMLGNYEFYYAAGLLKKLCGLTIDAQMQPRELYAAIEEQTKALSPEDERLAHLLGMIRIYDVLDEYDVQMQELFAWGEKEPDLWEVQTEFRG